MATLDEIMAQGIDPNNKKPEAPEGLKGLSYMEAKRLREYQKQQDELAGKQKKNILGSQEEYVVPDIGYSKDFEESSKFDEAIGNYLQKVEEGQNLGDMRGGLQTNAGKVLNSLINNVAIAGSTAVLGTLSFVDGILTAMFTGENKFGDNTFSQAQNDFLNWMDKKVPTYRGNEYENKSLLGKMGTVTFWGDFIKNLGYTEGMMIPGMGAAGLGGKAANLFGASAKTSEMVARLTGSFVGAMTEASTEAVSNMENQKKYKKSVLQDSFDAQMQEAYKNGDQEKMYQLHQDKEKGLEAIEDDATRTANYIFWANTGILMGTNMINVGRVFGKAYDSGRRGLLHKVKIKAPSENGTMKEVVAGDLSREMLGKLSAEGISKGKEIARIAGQKTLDAAAEGFEEGTQSVISHTPEIGKDYNTFNDNALNTDKKELVDGFLNGWFKSITDNFKDKNTGVEVMMGFLTGLLGAPTYVRGTGITWGNGIITEINNAAREGKLSREAADNLNDILQHITTDDKFLARYKGLIRNEAYEDMKNAALELGDKVEYKNAESAQFISDVETFRKTGQVDMFKNIFNIMANISDEEAAELIKTTTDEQGNGPFSKSGKADSVEDVKNTIRENANRYIRNIDRIVEDASALELDPYLHADRLSDDEFNTLLYLKEQGINFDERVADMLDEIHLAFKYGKYDEITDALQSLVSNYDETVAKNNEKAKRLRSYNEDSIKAGINRRRDVSAIADYLNGKVDKSALGREDIKIYNAVINGDYSQYYLAQPNEYGSYDVLDPKDFDKLTDIVKKNKGSFTKSLESIITSFKNNTIAELILNFDNVRASFGFLTAALNEDYLNDDTTETLENIRTLLDDVQRVSSASSYYNSEFNRLYKEYGEEAKKRGIGGRIKESVEKAVDKVKTKKKAKDIRKAKEEAGEDTSTKTDEEIIEEAKKTESTIEQIEAEIATVKDAILNAIALSPDEKNTLSQFLEDLQVQFLRENDLDKLSSEDKIKAYKSVIEGLLNHDNYDFSTGLLNDKLNSLKDKIRELSEKRGLYSKQKEEKQKERLFGNVPNPVAPTTAEMQNPEEPEEPEQFYEGSTEDGVINTKEPLDYLTNSVPELAWEFRGTKWGYLPADAAPDTAVGLQGETLPANYKAVVGILRGLGAYEAVSHLLGDKLDRGEKVKIYFLMMNADLHKFKSEGQEEKIPTIYHAVELDEKEDKEWIQKHDKSIIEINGKKYQVIGAHPENVKVNNLKELNDKIRKAAGDPETWTNKKWISDFGPELVKIIGGRSKIKQYDIKTADANLVNTLERSNVKPNEVLIGVVTQSTQNDFRIKYMLPDGSIGEAKVGSSNMRSGNVLLLPSANPTKYRYVQLVVPFLSDYLRDPGNSNTEYVKKLVDTFDLILKEKAKDTPNEARIKKGLNMLNTLVYFGNKNINDNTAILFNAFKKEGVTEFKIGFTNPSVKDTESKEHVIHARALSIADNASDSERKEAILEFLKTSFADIIEDNRLKGDAKVPLVRISIGYPTGVGSYGNKATALGMDSAMDYVEFMINSNLLKTDISDTEEVGAGYILQKYNPEKDAFEEGQDTPKPARKAPSVPAGVDSNAIPNTAVGVTNIINLENNTPVKWNMIFKINPDNKFLDIQIKSGETIRKLPYSIFRKELRQEIENAIITNSALPALPNIYSLVKNGKTYFGTYGASGNLTIIEEGSGSILDWNSEEGKEMYEYFENTINNIQTVPLETPKKEEIKKTPSVTVKYKTTTGIEKTYTVSNDHIYDETGLEVFKENSTDRRKILSQAKIKSGEAVLVKYDNKFFMVDKSGEITPMVKGGELVDWNGTAADKNAIIKLASDTFKKKGIETNPTPAPQPKPEPVTPVEPNKFTTGFETKTTVTDADIASIPQNERRIVESGVKKKLDIYEKQIRLSKGQHAGDGESAKLTESDMKYLSTAAKNILQAGKKEAKEELEWEDRHIALFEQLFMKGVNDRNAQMLANGERAKAYTKTEKRAKLEKELSWLRTVLPKAQVEVVKEGFVKLLSDPNGLYVGKFMNNAIYISEQYATQGTVYHEAFHYVFNALMSSAERNALFESVDRIAENKLSPIEKEEWLADNFAIYISNRNSSFIKKLGTAIKEFFIKLAAYVGIISNARVKLMDIYKSINKGLYSTRDIIENSVAAEKGKRTTNQDIFDSLKKRFDSLGDMYHYKVVDSTNGDYKFILQFNSPEEANNSRYNIGQEFKGLPVTWDFIPTESMALYTGDYKQGTSKYGLGIKFEYSNMREALGIRQDSSKQSTDETVEQSAEDQRWRQKKETAIGIASRNGEDISGTVDSMSEDALDSYINCR